MTTLNDATVRHLLVVDDDDRIRTLLKEFLSRHGFRVTAAAHADAAKRMLQLLDFDLLILDVMMPGEDGFSLSKWVRANSTVPILILTARGDSTDRITGLSLGADDYLAKPFEPQELLLRIEAILRRTGVKSALPKSVAMGPFIFDLERAELSKSGSPIRLTEAESQLLKYLAERANVPVDRMDLAKDSVDTTGRAVDVQVTRLRRKIEQDPKNPRYLQTVRGKGYMLAPD
ncbi:MULTISPECIES: response regulator [Asticcacaulis]|uniref:response regulator n=1 Tax=Asticcacaulis TaxID=76890 RepID=UPI001AE964B2|nr:MULTISPECIES: response regulator [Asticcacaulis]MBP2158635.1 two-component system phosphate regulon response regulator OmpR [Asticcacaulis solisilvae]MDR6799681.1 two-component system phosphate regulon response regulator OmpR [Asticcacaulis sp. BE141]